MTSINIPFAIGATVWLADSQPRPTTMTCPDCLGSGTIKMVLGNGGEHTLACATCSHGYGGPRGFVTRDDVAYTPRTIVLRRLTGVSPIQYTDAPEGVSCYRVYDQSELFADRSTCAARCVELQARHDIEAERQHIARLASKRKEAAWSVHYWRRKVEECKRDLAAAEKVLCALPLLEDKHTS